MTLEQIKIASTMFGDFVATKMRISGWDIQVVVEELCGSGPDTPAEVDISSRYRSATIRVSKSNYKDLEYLYKNIVHEMCHIALHHIDIILDGIKAMISEGPSFLFVMEVCKFADENMTVTLESLFLREVDSSGIMSQVREEVKKYEEENASKSEEGEDPCKGEDTNS